MKMKELIRSHANSSFIKTIRARKIHYIQTSTIHGVPRMFTAGRIESCIWIWVVLSGVGISIFGMSTMISKYYRYEIYTSVSTHITEINYFPSVTFCDEELMLNNYFAYCNRSKAENHADNGKNYTYRSLPCTNFQEHIREVGNTVPGSGNWSNDMFVVEECRSWSGKICADQCHFKSLSKHNHTCFTFNYDGNFYDPFGIVEIKFRHIDKSGRRFSRMMAIAHDPNVTELQMMFQMFLVPLRTYDLKVQKTIINRLKKPFPSNCTDEKHWDIFKGKYTRTGCMDSINFLGMLKACGDTFDYIKRVIPRSIFKKFRRNVTVEEAWQCMKTFSNKIVNATNECPVPCQEMELSTTSLFYDVQHNNWSLPHSVYTNDYTRYGPLYTVHVQQEKFDSHDVIQEKQLYTWDQIAGEVGGFLGLLIGVSFVSIVELLAYFALSIVERCAHVRF